MRLDGLLWDWKCNMQSGKLKQGLWGEIRGGEEPVFSYLLATCELCHQSFSFDKPSMSYHSLWHVHWSFLKLCCGRHLPPSPRVALPLPFLPSPLFVDVDVACRKGCFQKYIFLVTCLLGEEERGAHLCLGGLLEKQTNKQTCAVCWTSPITESLWQRKMGLAFGTYIWPRHWYWIADYNGGNAWFRQPVWNRGWISPKSLKQPQWASPKPIL